MKDTTVNLKTSSDMSAQITRGRVAAEDVTAKDRNHVLIEILRADGSREFLAEGFNARTNSGANWQASIMGSASGNPANYVALSGTVLTPAATDTTLSGEITSGTNAGLARALGTYQNYTAPSMLGGAASYQITHTFTSSGTTTVNSAALFDASTGGNLFVEANLSPAATLASGDSIALTWTVNI